MPTVQQKPGALEFSQSTRQDPVAALSSGHGRADALAHAQNTHDLVILWARTLDQKIPPLLTAAGALVAAILAVLEQGTSFLAGRPITRDLLALSLLPTLYSLLMAISTISPALKFARWGTNRHLPERLAGKPKSVIFFGHIAQYEDAGAYAAAAKAKYADEAALLDDLLAQTYLNSKIVQNKSVHIAGSARGLFAAILLIAISAIMFALKR